MGEKERERKESVINTHVKIITAKKSMINKMKTIQHR
jgi:hypothetical protein